MRIEPKLTDARTEPRLNDNNLVLWLNDNGKTNSIWKDYSGKNYHGTVYGAGTPPAATPGALGYIFDGVDDYIALSVTIPQLTLTNDKTISLWAKVTANGVDAFASQVAIRLKCGVYIHYRLTSNDITFRFDNAGTVSVSYSIGTNNFGWHKIDGIYKNDGTNSILVLYVDGIYRSNIINVKIPDVYSENSIGKLSTTYFNGSIDEVRIYNRALSQKEITLLFNSTRDKFGV